MYKRKDGRWQADYRINGKKVAFSSAEKSESAARREIERKMLAWQEKEHPTEHIFLDLAERMLDAREGSVEETTLKCYKLAIARAPELHDLPIETIEPAAVQACLNRLARQGYSFSSVHKTKVAIGLVFDHAIVEEGVKIVNFMRSVKLPRNLPKSTVTHPSDQVIEKIVQCAETVDFGLWAAVALFTGCCRGELNALQVSDVDYQERTISITKATAFPVNQPVLKAPKTRARIGKVPILSMCEPYLHRLTDGRKSTDFLFGGAQPLTKTQIRKAWVKYCAAIGESFTEHQLRHAYALLLYRANVPPKTAQRYLRHASFQVTMDIYTGFDHEFAPERITPIDDYLVAAFPKSGAKNVLQNADFSHG